MYDNLIHIEYRTPGSRRGLIFHTNVKVTPMLQTVMKVFLGCRRNLVVYQSQNRKGREILPSLSYHSNENNRQMEDDILKSVTYGGH